MITFIVVATLLLTYTTYSLYKQKAFSRRQEKELEIVLNRISDGVVSVDQNWRYTFLNDAAMATHPYSKEETLGKIIWDVHPEMKGTIFWDTYHEAMRSKKVQEIENYYPPMNIWFSVKVYPAVNGLTIFYKDISSSKQAQQKLSESLKETTDYKYAIDASSIVAITDQKGIIQYVNDNFCKIAKYSREELIGQDHRIINSGYHSKEFIRDIWLSIAHGHIWTGEIKNKAKDGSTYWVDTTIVPFLNAVGKPYQYIAIRYDITSRKQLEVQQLLYTSIVNSSDDAIVSKSLDGIVTSWNHGAENIFGYTSAEMVGNNITMIIPQHLQHEEEIILQEIKSGKVVQHYETERKRKDGTIIYVSLTISPIKDTHDTIIGISKIARNITEKKKAEQQLLELNASLDQKVLERTNQLLQAKNQLTQTLARSTFLASIADNIQDPVITSDNNSIITRWNHTAEKLLEWKSEEVIGKTTTEILATSFPGPTREQILASFAEKEYWQGEVIYHTKSGRPVHVLVTASKLKDTEGNVTGNLILVRDITERIKSEKQLVEFKHFFTNSNDISGIANTEGFFEILNPTFEKILGYTKNELLQNPFLEFVHPDDIAATLHEYEKLKSGVQVINFVNRYRKKDGNYLWFDWNATPNPETGKLYCIARDITERIKADAALNKLNEELEQRVKERTEELAASEMLFRSLIENSAEGITLTDKNSNVIYRSPGSEKITGIFPKENAINIAHPDDIDVIKKNFQELLNKPGIPINFQGRFLHASGHYIWLEGTFTNLLHVKEVNAIVVNYRDITSRKKSEMALMESEAKYRNVVENIHEALIIEDAQGNLVYANTEFYKMFGYRPDEHKALTLKDYTAEDSYPEVLERHNNRMKGLQVADDFEYKGKRKDGTEIWIEARVTAIRENDKIVRTQSLESDITERKKAEEELSKNLIELERSNKELEQFAYIASHDLQEPLRMVGSYMQLLERRYKGKLDKDADEFINFAIDGATRMKQLINDLLNYSRLNKEVNIIPVNLNEVVADVKQNLAASIKERNATVNCSEMPVMNVDKTQMIQLFQNLISNALKFVKSGIDPVVNIKAQKMDNKWLFTISDNGIGIEKQFADRIFIVFKQLHTKAKYGGTGIGLAIAKKIVERYGGEIWYESENGSGTTFHFTLTTKI